MARLNDEDSIKKAAGAKTAKRRQALKAASAVERAQVRGRNDPFIDIELRHRALAELKAAPRRVRETEDQQKAAVMRSISTFGFVVPVLVRGDHIVHGHTQVEAMRALGAETAPCIDVSHLSADQARALGISLNRTAETGTWDFEGLRLELLELDALDFDLDATGFTPIELDLLCLEEEPVEPKLDELPPVPPIPVTQLGQLWALGDHRIFCGDAREEASYAAALERAKATAVFADPPYNCPIPGHVSGLGKVKHEDFLCASGEMSRAEFHAFLASFLKLCRQHLIAGGTGFFCMDWRQIDILYAATREAGFTIANLICWIKQGGMGGFYRSAHELIVAACNGERPAINNIKLGRHGRDRTNAWHYPGANSRGSSSSRMLQNHPTPKPENLVADALLDVTARGDIVLDPFLGSGTTLIAAEKTGRIARCIELEPRFVDVSILRWQALTEKDAIDVATGQTFDALKGSLDVQARDERAGAAGDE